MIRGYFRPIRGETISVGKRPYLNVFIDIPDIGLSNMEVEFLVDTGADGVVLGTLEAQYLRDNFPVNFSELPVHHSRGVGGQARIRAAQAILTMGEFSIIVEIGILEPPPRPEEPLPVPSLLGRSVISQFALVVDERTDRILLLDADEFDALEVPR